MRNTKQKIVALFLMAIVMVGILGMTVCAEPQKRSYDRCYVKTNGGNLNGRSGPGTEYSIICQYANGTELRWSTMPEEGGIDNQGRDWLHVTGITTKGEEMEAWVLEEYLYFEPDPIPRSSDIVIKIDPNMPSVG